MKRLVCSQRKQAGRSRSSAAGSEYVDDFLSGLKKGPFQCSVLSCTRQRSIRIIQRVTWANGQPSCTSPCPHCSLIAKNKKQKQGVSLNTLPDYPPQENSFSVFFHQCYSPQALHVSWPHILPATQKREVCPGALWPHKKQMSKELNTQTRHQREKTTPMFSAAAKKIKKIKWNAAKMKILFC